MSTFGDDLSPQEVTYRQIAEQVRGMAPRALTPASLDNAITLVEFMRDEVIKRHDANIARAQELVAWEQTLEKRARDLKLHERACAALLKGNEPKRISNLWR